MKRGSEIALYIGSQYAATRITAMVQTAHSMYKPSHQLTNNTEYDIRFKRSFTLVLIASIATSLHLIGLSTRYASKYHVRCYKSLPTSV